MEVDGETQRVRPGDAILIPAGAWHTLENDGTSELRILCMLLAAVLARRHVSRVKALRTSPGRGFAASRVLRGRWWLAIPDPRSAASRSAWRDGCPPGAPAL